MKTWQKSRWMVLPGLLCVLATWGGSTEAALPALLSSGERLPSLAPMLERVTPTVVNIATYTRVQVRNPLMEDPFFRRFFNVPGDTPRRYRRAQAAGSGVIVDADKGYIVTNYHVVDSADEIQVTFADGRTVQAKLIGSDGQVDLAVLKVEADDLHQIDFSDSQSLRVGDFVVAIGNPFGLEQTVTSGIVSALGRSGLGIEGYEDFIQTDASINPGNSGGALVDLAGQLIGINTAILAPSGGNVGIGFAIPSNLVRAVMQQLIKHGEVRRGHIGLSVQGLNQQLAQAFGVDRRDGVVVVEVEPGSAAAEAGLEAGDIITGINGRPIQKVVDYHSATAVTLVEDELKMDLLRNGRSRSVILKIGAKSYEKIEGVRLDPRLRGTLLQNFRSQGDASAGAGVLLTEVESGSPGWNFGLRAGDIVVAVNRRPVRNLSDLTEGLKHSSREILLRVYRSGEFGYVVIR